MQGSLSRKVLRVTKKTGTKIEIDVSHIVHPSRNTEIVYAQLHWMLREHDAIGGVLLAKGGPFSTRIIGEILR